MLQQRLFGSLKMTDNQHRGSTLDSFLESEGISDVPGYDLLTSVQASVGDGIQTLGDKGNCRFCGETDLKFFRDRSHTFPEGLGNKWIFSADECDKCNKKFADYDDALCKSVGPILTIGGTKGKENKVRQTGRSKGGHNIRHLTESGQRRISVQLLDIDKNIQPPTGSVISFGPDQKIAIDTPTPNEKFVPRLAYKALVKMGIALLPLDELPNFSRLINWIQSPSDNEDFPFLDVGISVGSLGNAPELLSAVIFRRRDGVKNRPYIIFVLTIGSICWQIDLMPDTLDDRMGIARFGCINIRWKAALEAPKCEPLEIQFSAQRHFDWSSNVSMPIPISAMRSHFDGSTLEGSFELQWRDQLPA
jgi:hypothetical protein